ncbi:MAG: ParB/RepB/Spo0J family partition protein, partial [Candidatus Buchananbacteria bacterium]
MAGIKLPKTIAINPFEVRPLPGQIRQHFAGVKELADSIKEIGQVMPIIVTELRSPSGPYRVQLVDGERRLAACQYLKRGIVAFVTDGSLEPEEIYALSVAANFGRQPHDPIEILQAILTFKKYGKTNEQIARVFGKSVAWVCQHYLLRKLDPIVQGWMIPKVAAGTNGQSNNGKC